MRVTVFETVDIQTEVDVSVHDLLVEFSERMDRAEQYGAVPYQSVYLPLVDFATKLLARIPQKGIGACLDSQRAEVVKRLTAEAERWNEIYVSVD